MRKLCTLSLTLALLMLAGCSKSHVSYSSGANYTPARHAPTPTAQGGYVKTGKPYQVAGKWYYPLASAAGYDQTGTASWYGSKFHGRKTANGERYDMHAMSAAHKTLPMPTMVRVTNLDNGRSVIVRVNDRGPFVKNRLIDLSYAAARALGYDKKGTAHVRVQSLDAQAKSTPAPVKAQPKQSSYDPALGGIYVQLGAFSSQFNADRLRRQLLDKYPNIRVYHVGHAPLYRVRIGPYNTVPESEAILIALQQQGYDRAILVIE